MIIQRMVFRLKYGELHKATSLWKQILAELRSMEATKSKHVRFTSSLTGRAYTFCEDLNMKSFNEIGPIMYYWMTNENVQKLYREFVDCCDSAERQIYKIENEVGSVTNFQNMLVEKNRFQLHFGKAKESIALWQEIMEEVKNNNGPHMRLLTDLVGPSYTLLAEAFLNSTGEIKPKTDCWCINGKVEELYKKFAPLCDWAEREYDLIEF